MTPRAVIHQRLMVLRTTTGNGRSMRRKTILGGLSIVGQAARDHMRMSEKYEKYYDFEAALEKTSHWWWVAKIQYDF